MARVTVRRRSLALATILLSGCVPARPVTMPVPRYPAMLQSALVTGDVPVRLSIDRAGAVRAVHVDSSAGVPAAAWNLFDFAARRAMRAATFEPARRFGVPAGDEVHITVRFVLVRSRAPLRENERPGRADSLAASCPESASPTVIIVCARAPESRPVVLY